MIKLFEYQKKFRKENIIIHFKYPDHSIYSTLTFNTWKELYPDTKEMLPNKSEISDEKVAPVRITVFKVADHAHDIFTRRSVINILLIKNTIPVKWISKRQQTLETSIHGSKSVISETAVELILEY